MASTRSRTDRFTSSWEYERKECRKASPKNVPPALDREELASYVRQELSQTERLILMLHYAEELPFEEVAGILDMPQKEVEQIHRKLVSRMRSAVRQDRTRKPALAGAR